MSAQTDRLVVWRSIRCDTLGLNAGSNAAGLKTILDLSTRLGSRSSPRVWVRLTIRFFVGPRTGHFPCGSPPNWVVRARQLLLRRLC
jgi:hypothetical protein